MDLKALMQKLETIDTTQIVNESVETKQVITESVEEPVRQSAEPVFTSSIARGLAEDFGYELDEAEGTSPWANDPAKDAAWKALSPEDQKWLGGADPTDKFILARAPNKGKPATTAPGVAAGAATKPTATPAVAPGGVQAMGDDDGNTMITKPDGTVQVVGPDGKPLPNGGKVDTGAATKPSATGTPPAGGAGGDAAVKATREKLTALLDKLEKTGGVSGAAPAPAAPANPATGAATKQSAPVSGAQSAGQSVGGAIKSGAQAVGDFAKGAYQGLTKESVSFEDDKTLLAIKNIRY
jgi:hypothetical protein